MAKTYSHAYKRFISTNSFCSRGSSTWENKILYIFLWLHFLTAAIGSQALRFSDMLWSLAFSSDTQNLSPLCSHTPHPVPLLTEMYCFPLSYLKLHMPDILLNSAWVLMLYGSQGSCWYMVFLNHLSLLNTRLCSQVTPEHISHKTQAFVVLLFQNISQTSSLTHRHILQTVATNKMI